MATAFTVQTSSIHARIQTTSFSAHFENMSPVYVSHTLSLSLLITVTKKNKKNEHAEGGLAEQLVMTAEYLVELVLDLRHGHPAPRHGSSRAQGPLWPRLPLCWLVLVPEVPAMFF